MSRLEPPGSFEIIPSGIKTRQRNDFSGTIDGATYEYRTYILADTKVDSFDNPLEPSIPSGNETTWAFMWHYDDEPELSESAEDDSKIYNWIADNMVVSLEYGDNRFDNHIDVQDPYPTEDDDYTSIEIALGAGLGPISASSDILTRSFPADRVTTDDEDYQYTEWEIPVDGFPSGQRDAAGVAFDMSGGNSYTESTLSAEWSRDATLYEIDRNGYSTIYTADDGELLELDVDIVPDNEDI
ncbi:hypothetical protein RBH26_15640 [Natronolimnohabitans sp. A-GB9]|uniref:hypothetical protein n=1 Tax=Natronolimnohabitans sp. A-GB9 TaxID=3069757 RepID=UPI0027B2ED90|nr:hypothetical protein [Natronolimnohabitans sp. A-GB9]MDQ2051910.1 hypothetical protein [Natronolimnohabitans sp. A-GB9]